MHFFTSKASKLREPIRPTRTRGKCACCIPFPFLFYFLFYFIFSTSTASKLSEPFRPTRARRMRGTPWSQRSWRALKARRSAAYWRRGPCLQGGSMLGSPACAPPVCAQRLQQCLEPPATRYTPRGIPRQHVHFCTSKASTKVCNSAWSPPQHALYAEGASRVSTFTIALVKHVLLYS